MKKNILLNEVERLVGIVSHLRGPDGCPWDREQNYYTLKENIIEEAYEVVEALENKDLVNLKEELGDLLLQVVFQAQIATENKDFDLSEVFSLISDKLIRRHPHVFADTNVKSIAVVKENWDKIKSKEKNKKEFSILDKAKSGQPALNQAYDVQKIAAEVGFDWEETSEVINKIEEELSEVKEAISLNDEIKINEELGDLLFAVVNLARFQKVNPELSLLKAIIKFKKRFAYMEKDVSNKKVRIEDHSLAELDQLWEKAKEEFKEDLN